MKKQGGFVRLIVIIIVAIIALGYFGIDLEEAFTKPLVKKNLIFTWKTVKSVWTNYIYEPASGLLGKDEPGDSDEKDTDGTEGSDSGAAIDTTD